MIRDAMHSVHQAESDHNNGSIDKSRDNVLRAKQKFTAASQVTTDPGAKAKISAAIGILDGLSGGLTADTKGLPTAGSLMPKLPPPIVEALKLILTQSMQQLNPAEWLTSPDRVAQKWMDVKGLTTPNDVQRYIEQKIVNDHKKDAAGGSVGK